MAPTEALNRSWAPPAITFAFIFSMAVVGVLLADNLPLGPDAATRRLCDEAVANLLHSKDPLEVQRAGVIVHELDCSIRRRLGE